MFLIKPRRFIKPEKLLINIIKTTSLNVNQYLTIRLSTCPRTWHYPVIKMSTNILLSCYQNVNEYARILISTKINKATIFTLAVRTQNSGGETTSFRRIQLIANMHLIDVISHQSLYIELSL